MPRMNEDGQLVDEKRIPDSIKSLKRYPGLSISLEPDPQSGDPEVKVTELSTGTPIVAHTTRAFHRPSLERLGKKLQLGEGLKCALNTSSNIVELNVLKSAEVRDEDRDCKIMGAVDLASDVVGHKPIQDILQRSSMGINLAFNCEDQGNMVKTRSFVINDPTIHMQPQSEPWRTSNSLKTHEPIRLPREDSLAALARARNEELASRPLKEAHDFGGIQDIIGKDGLCLRDDEKVIISMSSNDSTYKIVKASDRVSIPKTLNALHNRSLASGSKDDMTVHHARFENEKAIAKNGGQLLTIDTELAVNNVAPASDLDNIGMIHDPTALERPLAGTNLSNLVDCSSISTNFMKDPKISGAHDEDMIQTANHNALANKSSDGYTVTKERLEGVVSGDSFMKMPLHDGLLESKDAALICDSVDHEFASMKSNQESDYNELPLIQREAKTVGLAPTTLLDSLNLDIPQLDGVDETSSSTSSYHAGVLMTTPHHEGCVEPCALCACMKGASLILQHENPLSNLRYRLCILETSQEAELLRTCIMRRGCLMALQICLFVLVVLWGGFLDMLATPPPT